MIEKAQPFFNPIYIRPYTWARLTVGNNKSLILMVLIHVALGGIAGFIFWDTIYFGFLFPLVLLGVFYPCLYLYCMFRLVKIIQELETSANARQSS